MISCLIKRTSVASSWPVSVCEQVKIEAAAGDRGQSQDFPGVLADLVKAALDGQLHAAREAQLAKGFGIHALTGRGDIASRKQRLERLLDKKRVALGHGIDRFEHLRPERALQGEDGTDLGIDIADREARQGDLRAQALTIKRGQEGGQLGMHLIAAIGQQQQDGQCWNVAGQREQDLQAGLVAPVQVFDDQQQRRCPAARGRALRRVRQLHQRQSQLALILLWVNRLDAGRCWGTARRSRGAASLMLCQQARTAWRSPQASVWRYQRAAHQAGARRAARDPARNSAP